MYSFLSLLNTATLWSNCDIDDAINNREPTSGSLPDSLDKERPCRTITLANYQIRLNYRNDLSVS